MNDDQREDGIEGKRRPAAARVMYFVLGCVHLFLLCHISTFRMGILRDAYVIVFTPLFFYLCYQGVDRPVRSTFRAILPVLNFLANIETSKLDTPIRAKLKGDTSSPSYKRYGE